MLSTTLNWPLAMDPFCIIHLRVTPSSCTPMLQALGRDGTGPGDPIGQTSSHRTKYAVIKKDGDAMGC